MGRASDLEWVKMIWLAYACIATEVFKCSQNKDLIVAAVCAVVH